MPTVGQPTGIADADLDAPADPGAQTGVRQDAVDPAVRPDPVRPWRGVLSRAREWYRRILAHWAFVLGLFVGSKLVLTVLGVLAMHQLGGTDRGRLLVSHHRYFSLWFAWDSFRYQQMENGAVWGSRHDTVTYTFFPLYPLLARPVAALLGGRDYFSLLVISNVALIGALYFAYRLGERLLGDGSQARVFTRYLLLMPAAFLFQAALTESLFLCLALACFHYAERGRWLVVGVLGFFLALARSPGFLIAIPLCVLLLQQSRYRFDPATLRRYLRVGWPLLLIPAGLGVFFTYCRVYTGDWLMYQHLQQGYWGIKPVNPVQWFWNGLHRPVGYADLFQIGFAAACVALALLCFRYVKPPYAIFALIYVAVPLTIDGSEQSVIRYLVVVFPLALMFARWVARRPSLDAYLTAVLAITQGIMLVAWINTDLHFII